MEKVEYGGIAAGGRIYSLRAAKGMTQEQLAAVLCVSPAAGRTDDCRGIEDDF